MARCVAREIPQQLARLAALGEQRMQAKGILDGVEAAGKARLMERIEVEPIEFHDLDMRQLTVPRLDRADERRKQIIDARPGPGRVAFALLAMQTRPGHASLSPAPQ